MIPSGVATTITSCDELVGLPVPALHARTGIARRIGDFNRESLGIEELDKPAAHLAAAADHERAPAGALPLRGELRLFLGRERAPDQEPEQIVGERRGKAELFRCGARIQEHVALALEIARRVAGRALDAGDFLGEPLPLGDEREQLAVEPGQPFAQFRKFHLDDPVGAIVLCTGPPAFAQAGRRFRSQPSIPKLKNQPSRGSCAQ